MESLFWNRNRYDEQDNHRSSDFQIVSENRHHLSRNILTIEKALWESSNRVGQQRDTFPIDKLLILLGECESIGYVNWSTLTWILATNGSDINICQLCTRIVLVTEMDTGASNTSTCVHENLDQLSYLLKNYEYCAEYVVKLLNQDQETILNVLKALQLPLGRYCKYYCCCCCCCCTFSQYFT